MILIWLFMVNHRSFLFGGETAVAVGFMEIGEEIHA